MSKKGESAPRMDTLHLDAVQLLHVSARPLDDDETSEDIENVEADERVIRVKAETLESDIHDDQVGEPPADMVYVAGLLGGFHVVYRRTVVIENVLIELGMMFSWRSEAMADYSDPKLLEGIEDYARNEAYHQAYPFIASRADAIYSLMGRVRGVSWLPADVPVSVESFDDVYRNPNATVFSHRDGDEEG